MDCSLSPELLLVTRKNVVKNYNEAISRIGAARYPITSPSYLNGMVAEALVGEKGTAVLLRTDLQMGDTAIVHTILHELAHIFCVLNEYGGRSFQQEYCRDEENHFLITGYSIWSEFVAEYMARRIEEAPALPLHRRKLTPILRRIRVNDPQAKRALSDYLALVMISTCSKQVQMRTDNLPFQNLIRLVKAQMSREAYYEISEFFISDLGSTYFYELTMAEMKRLRPVSQWRRKPRYRASFFVHTVTCCYLPLSDFYQFFILLLSA